MTKYLRYSFPFYPLLVGIYKIIFLSAVNVGQVTFGAVTRSLVVTILISLFVFLLCLVVIRNLHRAALLSGWLLAVLLLYGQFFSLLDGTDIGRHRIILPLVGVLTVAVLGFVFFTRKNLQNLSVIFNSVMLFLVVSAALPVITYQIQYGGSTRTAKNTTAVQADPSAPDVYYIILDGYARTDSLANDFNYDNRSFLDELHRLGFAIPECAFSNYITTTPSLSSSLNMDYLENMGVSEKATVDAFDPSLSKLLEESTVIQAFQDKGYKIAAFRGFIPALDLHNADYYFNLQEKEQRVDLIWLHNYERLYMRTSILRPLVEAYEADPNSLDKLPNWFLKFVRLQPDIYTIPDLQQYREMQYTFEVLHNIPELPGKKFVYAHIYATHTPYVFDTEGKYTPEDVHYEDKGYIPALEYTSNQILEIVQDLIEKSAVKPVIIIQSDHGFPSANGVAHNKILSAYYFPDGDYSRLYPTITPVNTFRVVLSQFFYQGYPLLPDTLLIKDQKAGGEQRIRHIPAACDAE